MLLRNYHEAGKNAHVELTKMNICEFVLIKKFAELLKVRNKDMNYRNCKNLKEKSKSMSSIYRRWPYIKYSKKMNLELPLFETETYS